jgi:hypothetical protein
VFVREQGQCKAKKYIGDLQATLDCGKLFDQAESV